MLKESKRWDEVLLSKIIAVYEKDKVCSSLRINYATVAFPPSSIS